MAFYPLERLHQLYDGYRRAFSVDGRSLLLIQDSNRLYLIENQCPHMNAPLSHASVAQGKIRCPMHGIEFDLTSGCAVNSGLRQGLKRLRPVYEGTQVGVEL